MKLLKKIPSKKKIIGSILTACISGIIIFFLICKIAVKIYYPEEYRPLINKYSNINNLDPLFVASVIYVESHYNPDAISKKGAVGLMQIMPQTAKFVIKKYKLKIKDKNIDLKNPELNIKIGTYYLRYIMNKSKNKTDIVLAMYNAGITNVNKWKKKSKGDFGKGLKTHGFKETQEYVKKVNDIYNRLKCFEKFNLI